MFVFACAFAVLACDANCNTTTGTGCNKKGASFCDEVCNIGYAVDSSFMCQGNDPADCLMSMYCE